MNVAPTDEVVLLAAGMGPWHSIALVLVSLAIMHGSSYSGDGAAQLRALADGYAEMVSAA